MFEKKLDREGFLAQLRRHLRRLPKEEIESAVAFYNEYIDEAGEGNEEDTIKLLGPPREVALHIITKRTRLDIETSPPTVKKGISAIWVVILAVLASPIALPLAVTALVLLITAMVVVFSVIITFIAVGLSLIMAAFALCFGLFVGGVLYIVISMPLVFQNVLTGIFYLGSGLSLVSISYLLFPVIMKLAQFTWRGTCTIIGKQIPRLIMKLAPKKYGGGHDEIME